MATNQAFGATTLQQQPTSTASSTGYQYLNKGWQDPLAQEISKKYLINPNNRPTVWSPEGPNDSYRQLKGLSNMYHAGGSSGGGYRDPLDPKNWQASGVW